MIRIVKINGDDARASTTADGFLEIAGAVIARAGVLEYKTGSGSVVRELRDPDVIHNSESLKSYEGRPVLLGKHPTTKTGQVTLATDENIKSLPVIGSMRNIRADYALDKSGVRHKVTKADVLIWNPDGINAARQGIRQFSVGYRTSTELKPGTFDGQSYDARQLIDEGNHLVLTASARAGDITEFRLDDRDAIVVTNGENMAKYKIDDVEGEVSENLSPIIDDKIARLSTAESEIATLSSDKQALQAKIVELESKLVELESTGDMQMKDKDKVDEKGDVKDRIENIDELVSKRIELVDQSRQLVGKDYKWSKKTDRQIRADAISAVLPNLEIHGLTDEEIIGAYLVAVAQHSTSSASTRNLANATRGDDAINKNTTSARDRARLWYMDRTIRKGDN